MGLTPSCEWQKTKLDKVVYICCMDEKNEFGNKDMSLIVKDRKGLLAHKGSGRTSVQWRSESKQLPDKDSYEYCCACDCDDFDTRIPSDRPSDFTGRAETKRNGEHSKTYQIPQSRFVRSGSELGNWTDEELLHLSRTVEATARKLRVKSPGFATIQATRKHACRAFAMPNA